MTRTDHDYDYYDGDRGVNRRRKRPRRNFYDDRGLDMVVAGFPGDRDGRHRDNNIMQRRYNPEDPRHTQKRDWRTRQPRDDTRTSHSAKEQLDGPCTLHGFRNERGEIRSSHILRNSRRFTEFSKEKSQSTDPTTQPLASVAVGPITHNAPPPPAAPARQVAAM